MDQSPSPHVLFLPFSADGHIKPMFNLAKLLSHKGFTITFVTSHQYHSRLHQFTDLPVFHTQFLDFHFTSITDGIPPDYPIPLPNYFELVVSPASRSMVAKEFRDLFISISQKTPPTCIIADGIMSTIAMDVAEKFHVPVISFRTYSATCTWVTFHLTKLIKEGVIPVQNQEDMGKLVTSIPGLQNLLRHQDLPGMCRLNPGNTVLDFYIKETSAMARASALILNTFDKLEAPIISELATIFPKVFTIGPLHGLFKTHIPSSNSLSKNHGSLRKEDRSCMTWLDSQKPRTVLYVSFGTVVGLSREQLLEFWHGFVNSGKPFLWVIREGLIVGEGGSGGNVPAELELKTKERGFVVDWAPQEEVLAHPAVGGFMSHSGWNSTLESISEGVPMICWPLIADQTVNSRCVSELWRNGVDMKGRCDRLVVEKMMRDLMENQREEIMRSTEEIARMASESIKRGGSSCHNLEKLIEDIRSMSLTN